MLYLEKKCQVYIQNNLRAPPIALVKKWGKQLKFSAEEIQNVNENIQLRHQLGIFIDPKIIEIKKKFF
jgi:hypothetical protein